MMDSTPRLSIVIPAYNEEKRIGRALDHIRAYFAASGGGLEPKEVEILVVDDGSADTTACVVESYMHEAPRVRLLTNGTNHGKGYSVRHGVREARGRVVLFTDTDLSAPIEESSKLLVAIQAGSDAAIGSRGLDRSLIEKHQSQIREAAGIVFNLIVRLLTGLPFRDTQCGFKAFVRERCSIVFEQQRVDRFGFDPEILFLARRHGLKVAEIPVRWSHDSGTKVNVARDSLQMLWDVVRIRWNCLLNRYPKVTS
jgi:glycosyltransferase involved in cell wall biosynthesis